MRESGGRRAWSVEADVELRWSGEPLAIERFGGRKTVVTMEGGATSITRGIFDKIQKRRHVAPGDEPSHQGCTLAIKNSLAAWLRGVVLHRKEVRGRPDHSVVSRGSEVGLVSGLLIRGIEENRQPLVCPSGRWPFREAIRQDDVNELVGEGIRHMTITDDIDSAKGNLIARKLDRSGTAGAAGWSPDRCRKARFGSVDMNLARHDPRPWRGFTENSSNDPPTYRFSMLPDDLRPRGCGTVDPDVLDLRGTDASRRDCDDNAQRPKDRRPNRARLRRPQAPGIPPKA